MGYTIKPMHELMTERNFAKAQRYVDTEVVRLSEKYTPFRRGYLKKAMGTVYGSGKVKYNLPYAAKNYYDNEGRGTEGTQLGGLRGKRWLDRMKAVHKGDILRGVAQLTGGKVR